jgi:hypothetical protein
MFLIFSMFLTFSSLLLACTQDFGITGFLVFSTSQFPKKNARKHKVPGTGCFHHQIKVGVTYYGPAIEVSYFYRTQQSRCLPFTFKKETKPVSETLCSVVFYIIQNGGQNVNSQ